MLKEPQLKALEKVKEKQENGELETQYPGWLGAQDTYNVGHIKDIGKIYQQTLIDAYSQVTVAKLYAEKNPRIAADLLNDTVIPLFDDQGVSLLRILTDGGTENCGKKETYAYQLYLNLEDIAHTKTKAYSSQTHGICDCFHKTMKSECYDVMFHRKSYHSLKEIQIDADRWMVFYNQVRPYSGKYCYGKMPWQTWLDAKTLAKDKQLDSLA